jgi:hypothetical protein
MNRFVTVVALTVSVSLARVASGQTVEHWYRCNTHTHTASFPTSDANASPEFAVRWYQRHGYQCVVITDHEHLTPVDFLNEQFGGNGEFLVIAGQEITQGIKDPATRTGVRWAHVNAINSNRAIMPLGLPEIPSDVSLSDTYLRNVKEVYAAGGLPQINHPNGAIGPHLADLLPIDRPMLFEVWNAFPSVGALGGADEKGVVTPSFEALWDSLLSHGKTVWGVATDDVHDYFNFDDRSAPTPGKAWIVVRAPALTLDAVMEALRRGRFYASTGVALADYRIDAKGIAIRIDPPFAWRSRDKETVLYRTRFVGRDGRTLAEMPGLATHYEFSGSETYVRATIVDSDGRRAWTQPVFRDGRAAP